MDGTALPLRSKFEEQIGGDRRQDRRYFIQLDVRWKLIRRRRVLDTGTGSTVDLSSGGILFDAGRELPPGLNVELSISWPVLLHNVAPLNLIVTGRIVRCLGSRIAVRMNQHEFRTTGIPNDQHRDLATSTVRNSGLLSKTGFFGNFDNKIH